MLARLFSSFNIAEAKPDIDKETNLIDVQSYFSLLASKQFELAKEVEQQGEGTPTHTKYIILQKLTKDLQLVFNVRSGFLSLDDKLKHRQDIIKILMNILNSLSKEQVAALMVKRNNRQYYVNIATSGSILVAGAAAEIIFPQTFLGTLCAYYGSYQFTYSYLSDFNNFVPASIKLILDLYKKLLHLDNQLTQHFTKMNPQASHYDTLGIPQSATKDDILKAFRILAKTHHPDRGGKIEIFKQINEAKDILTDETKREYYDVSIGINKSVFRFR